MTTRAAVAQWPGALDTSFNTDGLGANLDVESFSPAGPYCIGGLFSAFNGIARGRVALLNSDGTLSESFPASTGASSWVYALAYQSGTLPNPSYIYVAGAFSTYAGTAAGRIVKLTTAGVRDATFDANVGAGITGGNVYSTEIGGRAGIPFTPTFILVGGSFTAVNGTPRSKLARVNLDGILDTAFDVGTGPGGGPTELKSVQGVVNEPCISVARTNAAVAVGYFSSFNGNVNAHGIVRLNASGSIHSDFSPGAGPNINHVSCVLRLSNGKLLIGGNFTGYDGRPCFGVARLNPNCSLDSSFDSSSVIPFSGGSYWVYALALQSDGKLLIGGDFNYDAGGGPCYNVARLNADGSLDTSFYVLGPWNGRVKAIRALSGGKALLGGVFTTYNDNYGDVPQGRVARVWLDGPPTDPSISPPSATLSPGSGITFRYTGNGTSLSYSWNSNNVNIAGATNPTLACANVQYNAAYRVVVNNLTGSATSQVAQLTVLYQPGMEFPAPLGGFATNKPYWTPQEAASWLDGPSKLFAANPTNTTTVTITWTNPGAAVVVSALVTNVQSPTVELTQQIQPPPNADTNNKPSFDESAAYWHPPTHRLYAIKYGFHTNTWFSSSNAPILMRVQCNWPADTNRYQIYVSGSPATDLALAGGSSSARITDNDPGVTPALARTLFSASGFGKSLILLSPSVSDVTNIYFQLVRTVLWTDPSFLLEAGAPIGQEIPTFGLHEPAFRQPWLVNTNSRYCTNFYDRADRTGPIIPVNRDWTNTPNDDMVLVCYQSGARLWDPVAAGYVATPGIGWPYKPVRYNCQWPTVPENTIIIASQVGSGRVPSDSYSIYYQNDPNQPGFNPNEEHALKSTPSGDLPTFRVDATRVQIVDGSLGEIVETNGVVVTHRLAMNGTGFTAVEVTLFSPQALTKEVQVSVAPKQPAANVFASFSTNELVLETVFTATDVANGSAKSLYLGALSDTNAPMTSRTTNLFELRASGGLVLRQEVEVQAVPTNQLALVLGATALVVPENSQQRSFTVRLSAPPTNTVTVRTTWVSDDTDLTVRNGATLSFDSGNWAALQTVGISAGADPDADNGVAYFQVVASGGLNTTNVVQVTELDGDPSSSEAVFALRDDLGDAPGQANPQLSEPYVLLACTNSQGLQHMLVYRVVAQQGLTVLNYPGIAGRQVQPPNPLDFYGWQSNAVYGRMSGSTFIPNEGVGWRDRKGVLWARAGCATCADNSPTNIITRYAYPHKPAEGFYLPAGYAPWPNGWIPWLDLRAGTRGIPINVTNAITWPTDAPELRVGETLVKAKFGLPGIQGQTSAEILYEQTQARGMGPNSSVIVVDFASGNGFQLSSLPADLAGKTATNLIAQGDIPANSVFFTTLSPHLRSRVWYEPSAQRLNFKGQFVEEFGMEEPVGYLLLNVLTAGDSNQLVRLSEDGVFRAAVRNLAKTNASVRPATTTTLPKNLALTAGLARGTGYVALAFNNIVSDSLRADRGDPVSLEIIRVAGPNYRGDVKMIYAADPFSEDISLRHSGDFAGVADRYLFHWQYYDGAGKPRPGSTWNELGDPNGEAGALDQLVRASGRRSLKDCWYRCQWRSTDATHPCGTNFSAWTEPALTDGWMERVLAGINFFDQKYTDFVSSPVDTIVNVISQAGARSIGSVPLNAQAATNCGMIDIYETVLQRGINLSIEGNPPIADDQVSRQLLLVAGQLGNIYMLLGNEAYADAADPTIGLVAAPGQQYGVEATSVHCFMDQVGSLLGEELALLRGKDTRLAHPIYNRLPPNIGLPGSNEAEPAYVLNYDIKDKVDPIGTIDARDAQNIWPQGHGDAWGHYLMAIKNFYRLLRNPNFNWTVMSEWVSLEGGLGNVEVNHQQERKFAKVAAAKARTGAEIVNLTYRSRYVEDPSAQSAACRDSDRNRAWGLDDWGSRAGQGAYFDWVMGNALLPEVSTATNEVAKVDRTTVTELREIISAYTDIQAQLDQADAGLNPLGIAKNVIPFDIDPSQIAAGRTHFEQIYDRAVTAMNNAIGVFNRAQVSRQALRDQAENVDKFRDGVDDRENDFKNRLIEVFGYPYSGDPSGQAGQPDLFHYMYNDYSEITGQPRAPVYTVQVPVHSVEVNSNGALFTRTSLIPYHFAANGLGLVKPSSPDWGSRPAPGEIQMAHSELVQNLARFQRATREYENLLAQIEDQAALLQAQCNVDASEIHILTRGIGIQQGLNESIYQARQRQLNFQTVGRMATLIATAISEGVTAAMGDVGAIVRGAAWVVGNGTTEVMTQLANRESMAELDHQQAKEYAQAFQSIELTVLRQEQAILQQVAQLQQLVRQEALARLEIYTQQEALQQSAGRYASTLARGQRILEDRLRFRQQTAKNVQQYRWKDMAFRVFRDEAIQQFRAQFDLAARYVYLAAAAYDFETNLRDTETRWKPGSAILTDIVRARAIGVIDGQGNPQPGPGAGRRGDGGLAAALWSMNNSWNVGGGGSLRSQLGFNNPAREHIRVSLRAGLFRALTNNVGDDSWRGWLSSYIVPHVGDVPEFVRYCKPPNGFGLNGRKEPGIVIPFTSSIKYRCNFFGWPETGGGASFSSSYFATKIKSTSVRFSTYDATHLSTTPHAYLVPVGNDVLLSPITTAMEEAPQREWTVLDQFLPAPLNITNALSTFPAASWIPITEMQPSLDPSSGFLKIRRYAQMRAYHNGLNGTPTDPELESYKRLIGRSAWNTSWLLIILGGDLLGDQPEKGIDIFINGFYGDGYGVDDIFLDYETYSYPGA